MTFQHFESFSSCFFSVSRPAPPTRPIPSLPTRPGERPPIAPNKPGMSNGHWDLSIEPILVQSVLWPSYTGDISRSALPCFVLKIMFPTIWQICHGLLSLYMAPIATCRQAILSLLCDLKSIMWLNCLWTNVLEKRTTDNLTFPSKMWNFFKKKFLQKSLYVHVTLCPSRVYSSIFNLLHVTANIKQKGVFSFLLHKPPRSTYY